MTVITITGSTNKVDVGEDAQSFARPDKHHPETSIEEEVAVWLLAKFVRRLLTLDLLDEMSAAASAYVGVHGLADSAVVERRTTPVLREVRYIHVGCDVLWKPVPLMGPATLAWEHVPRADRSLKLVVQGARS